MSNFYTFLKGILATMLLLFVPNMALAHSGGITSQPNSSKAYSLNYSCYDKKKNVSLLIRK